MTSQLLVDGEERLAESPEFQARLAQLRREIEQRYAAELAEAGVFKGLYLRWKIAAEYHHQASRLYPSPESLYAVEKHDP
mgnify:CR=1 FL=1